MVNPQKQNYQELLFERSEFYRSPEKIILGRTDFTDDTDSFFLKKNYADSFLGVRHDSHANQISVVSCVPPVASVTLRDAERCDICVTLIISARRKYPFASVS